MNMKTRIISLAAVFFLLLTTLSSVVYAKSINSNFDNGKANGWYLGHSLAIPHMMGDWRVEDGVLIQDSGLDGVIALVEKGQFSEQTIETSVKLESISGVGGLTFWYQDDDNLMWVYIAPGSKTIRISERYGDVVIDTVFTDASLSFNTWYDLKVEADSVSGGLKVYLDGEYQFTHTVLTPIRIGQSGLVSGGAGKYFDNFKIKAKIH